MTAETPKTEFGIRNKLTVKYVSSQEIFNPRIRLEFVLVLTNLSFEYVSSFESRSARLLFVRQIFALLQS